MPRSSRSIRDESRGDDFVRLRHRLQARPGYPFPLDLFVEYQLSSSGLAVTFGATNLGNFNNAAANGGDIADWASNSPPSTHNYDAFDAFTYAGYHGVITPSDVIETAALGYDLTPTGVASA